MEINKETGEIKYEPKGKGSFWISKKAIGLLISYKSTALEIAAYLVMAKHTDKEGMLTTSGIKSIHKATGCSHSVIQRAVDRLLERAEGGKETPLHLTRLIYKADEWQELKKTAFPPAPFERAEVRYVINDYQAKPEDKIWISNELITGYGKFSQPLKKLKACGDIAARILLIGYRESNLEQYGGISPRAFHHSYTMEKIGGEHGFVMWHGKSEGESSNLIPEIFTKNSTTEQKDEFWEALQALDEAGFIYQMVSVMDREGENHQAQVIYELDAKSRHGYKPTGEQGLAGTTAKLANLWGYPVTDSIGRFYGNYAAIVQAGKPHIVGIYRLRFRVTNNKNHGIAAAWARIYQGQKETKELLDDLIAKSEIKSDLTTKAKEKESIL